MRLLAGTLVLMLSAGPVVAAPQPEDEVERIVTRHVKALLPDDGIGGAAVALRLEGRTLFFNYRWADAAAERPVTSDSLFNLGSLRKVFEATLLALAVESGRLALDDRVVDCLPELRPDRDIGRITIGQLATHTSGLLLPQDHPPWPNWGYTLPAFIHAMNDWTADIDHQPGGQHIYTHAGFILLALALERRLGQPIDELIEEAILRPLGMPSTSLPRRDNSPRGRLSPNDLRRAVQGYAEDGQPIGEPGDQQGYYNWPGTSQMFSSTRDLAEFLAANMGELAIDHALKDAIDLAQQGVYAMSPHNTQALAWEIIRGDEPTIFEKYGGLNNAGAYIAIMPSRRLGIVILNNRGNQYPNEAGRRILLELAGHSRTAEHD